MPDYYTRPISLKALVAVSQAILVYIDDHGRCTALNLSIASKAGVGMATARGCVTWLIGAGAFVVSYEWVPGKMTVRSLTLPDRKQLWRGVEYCGNWVRDPFEN